MLEQPITILGAGLGGLTLHALVIALTKLQAITPEQAGDLVVFLKERIGILEDVSGQASGGHSQ